MTEIPNSKPKYDLEERSARFAERCRDYVKELPKTTANFEYGKQLIRSSGSQAANYIEANEADTKKEFRYRIRVCRKETKESCLWLRLAEPAPDRTQDKQALLQEGTELRSIYTSIYESSSRQ